MTVWTPVRSDGTVDHREALRPWPEPAGTPFEVELFRGTEQNATLAAVFGVMAAFPEARFRVTVLRWEAFQTWFGWAVRQVKGVHRAPLGQLFRHHLLGAVDSPVFLANANTITRSPWPLRNVTLATVPLRTQREVDATVPKLLLAPAAVHEVVLAPVEQIDLTREGYLFTWCSRCEWRSGPEAAPMVGTLGYCCPGCGDREDALLFPRVDRVRIVGGSLVGHDLERLQDQVVSELGEHGFCTERGL